MLTYVLTIVGLITAVTAAVVGLGPDASMARKLSQEQALLATGPQAMTLAQETAHCLNQSRTDCLPLIRPVGKTWKQSPSYVGVASGCASSFQSSASATWAVKVGQGACPANAFTAFVAVEAAGTNKPFTEPDGWWFTPSTGSPIGVSLDEFSGAAPLATPDGTKLVYLWAKTVKAAND